MKRVLSGFCCVAALLTSLAGCNEEHITYNGDDFVMFADTLQVLPIQNNTESFDITIASLNSCAYDRTFGIEVLDRKSNAIEGVHYAIESNSVTIKAGSRSASLKVRGISENINVEDSIGIVLKLIAKNNNDPIYEGKMSEAKVLLQKACPLILEEFTGYCTLQSTFFRDYMKTTEMRILKSEIDPERENSIIIRDMFYSGHDVSIKLNNENILYPDIAMNGDQVIGHTDESFGTIYGNGDLMMTDLYGYVSYFSSCETFMIHYGLMYVENVGTVGSYVNILKWITDEEAEVLKRLGY